MIGEPDSLTFRFASLVGHPCLTILIKNIPLPPLATAQNESNIFFIDFFLYLKEFFFEIFENFDKDDIFEKYEKKQKKIEIEKKYFY